MKPLKWEDLTRSQIFEALDSASQRAVSQPEDPQATVEELFALVDSLRDHLIVVAANAHIEHVPPVLDVVFRGMKAAMEISTEIAKARVLYAGETAESEDNDAAPAAEEETNED